MTQWRIVVPVWGERYCTVFEHATLPAIRRAIDRLSLRAQLMIYTHDTDRLKQACAGLDAQFFPVPGPDNSFYSMSNAHRDAIKRVQLGGRIALLTADMVMSPSTLASCEDQFKTHKKMLVCCAGMRVNDTEFPPPFATGRALLAWGWNHRHHMTEQCTWPHGHSYDVWRMYFTDGEDEVVCRLCLPHPIALVRDGRTITFQPTIDVNVIANFSLSEMHLVTDPDEAALIELSPPDKEFVLTETMRARWERQLPSIPAFVKVGNPRHRWCLNHKIIIRGHGGPVGDEDVLRRLLDGQ